MPPVRSMPNTRPVRTERTHEENQERAYIAASRRSDRSLEARVESARRASEIHKKRTGRALRVTEQDVINEEMYEEEEEDLSAQYRRLTAHLHTGSIDFNRRFHAYIQAQTATRVAMAPYDSTAFANGGFMQPLPNQSAFNPQYMQMLPTHMIGTQMGPPSPRTYRQSPYPMASPPVYGQQNHQRSASIAEDLSGHSSAYTQLNISQDEQRRASHPTQVMPAPSPLSPLPVRPQISQAPSSAHIQSDSPEDTSSVYQGRSVAPADDAQNEQRSDDSNHPSMLSATTQPFSENLASHQPEPSPLSYALPLNCQQALGSSVERNNFPLDLMHGSGYVSQPKFYNYNPNANSKFFPDYSMTMAGNPMPLLDTTSDGMHLQAPLSATTVTSESGNVTPFTSGFTNPCLGMEPFPKDSTKSHDITRNDSSQSLFWDELLDLDMPGSN